MSPLLDPVWPWSRLWDMLLQVSPAIRVLAALAAIACLPLPVLARSRRRQQAWPPLRGLFTALLAVAGLSLGFVVRHLWPLVWSDAVHVTSSGFVAFFAALGWLLLLLLLLVGPFLLAGLSVTGYAGSGRVRPWRRGLIVGLRLLAFLLALLAVWRPALAQTESDQPRSLLYIVVDRSASMTYQDERGNLSRWKQMMRSIARSGDALGRLLDDHQVEVRWFAFDQDLHEFDPDNPGKPDGKGTDFGAMLRQLFDRRDAHVPLRGLLIISDGADNGVNIPALAEAARWRGVPCTIHTFACGSPSTSPTHKDVAITSVSTAPTPFVPVKGKLRVKLSIDARGYENTRAWVRLFLEGDDGKGKLVDREVTARDVVLPLTTGNEVSLECDAPAQPGEVKVKAVVETPEPDTFPLNNIIETFVTVSKEGISVLLVDRQRWEPNFICDALAEDPRIRVTPVWIRGGKPLPGTEVTRLFSQQEQPYDVIILGDVSLDQLRSIDAQAVAGIVKLVGRGSGLMVLGGYYNLGNGGWQGSPLEPLLPVDLSIREQVEGRVRMLPTEDGARRVPYILRLDSDPKLAEVWKGLARLDGYTRLELSPKRRGTELVLAEARRRDDEKGEPLLVMQNYSAGAGVGKGSVARVLVFGGDTTYRWKRTEKGAPLFDRFWKQVVVWLARQEDAAGSVWVRPDVRRLPARSELGFQVGMRGKGGGPDVRDGKYTVEVETPTGQKVRTPVVRGATENRGTFTATQTPGVYRIRVRGEGTDPSGGKVEGESSARVIVYDEDLEMSRPAADPEFLARLAAAGGGGESLRIEQLAGFLSRLAEQPLDRGKPKQTLRPDWQTRGKSPFLAIFFVVFCVVVCVEWALRRWWGLV
jgi:uncharacterized membrane protein